MSGGFATFYQNGLMGYTYLEGVHET